MSHESESKPARRVEDKRADGALDWSDAPRFTALGIAETWCVTVEAEGRRVLSISEQHCAGLADDDLEQFKETICSCAQHLLALVGSTPISGAAGDAHLARQSQQAERAVTVLETMIAETDLTYKKGILHEAVRRIQGAAPASQEGAHATLEEVQTAAARDVLAERRRQVEAEGWTPEHDDMHSDGQMAVAAGYYALACGYPHERDIAHGHTPTYWPWAPSWWKPRDKRANLVRAGALILAEIERIDRAAMSVSQDTTREAE